MADGALTIEIEQALADRLRAAAEASGSSFEAYVRHALEVFSGDAADWAEDIAIAEEYDRTGVSYSLEEGFETLDKALAEGRAARR